MKPSRIRTGERLALAGAIALVVLLCFDWFFLSTPDARVGAHESGWRSMGWFVSFLLIAAIGSALAMVFSVATQRAQAWPVVLTVFTCLLGTLASLAVLVRFVAQPGLGVDAGNADVDLAPAAFFGLVALLALTLGAWIGQWDERTGTAEAREQTDDVLRVRGAAQPPPREAPAGSPRPDPLAD